MKAGSEALHTNPKHSPPYSIITPLQVGKYQAASGFSSNCVLYHYTLVEAKSASTRIDERTSSPWRTLFGGTISEFCTGQSRTQQHCPLQSRELQPQELSKQLERRTRSTREGYPAVNGAIIYCSMSQRWTDHGCFSQSDCHAICGYWRAGHSYFTRLALALNLLFI